MKKNISTPLTVLIATILFVALLHACIKKGDVCRSCTAYNENDEQLNTQEVCSDEAENNFRSEYAGNGRYVTCF